MAKDFTKILDTRNLKAVKYRFDVRAEHTYYREKPALGDKVKRDDERGEFQPYPPPVKREEAALNPLDTWMP